MKFRKMFVLLVITVISIFVVSSAVSAWPWSKKKKKAEDYYPLYVDKYGWQIYGAVSTERVIYDMYLPAKEMAEKLGLDNASQEHFEYIINHGVDNFYDFVLAFPKNIVTFWSKKSQIIMTYITKGDTFKVASSELIFANICPNCKPAMIRSSEIQSYYSLPNKVIFRTPGGAPVISAGFDFDKNRPRPELIIKCSVRNVITSVKSENEVSKR